MELIPILSLIVLVATISTFILAVGAYVLYKVRERKGRVSQVPEPASIEAELISPSAASQQVTQEFTQYEPAPTRVTEPIYQRQMSRTTEQRRGGRPPMRPTYIGNNAVTRLTEERFTREMPAAAKTKQSDTKYQTSQKYMRYTSEGYVEPKKEDEKKKSSTTIKKEDKLRWR